MSVIIFLFGGAAGAQSSTDRSAQLHDRGKAAYAEGDLVAAIDYTQRALDLRLEREAEEPDPVLISAFNLGLYHQQLGEFRSALDYYGLLIERLPHRKEGDTYFQIGRIYLETGALESAEIAFNAALSAPAFSTPGPRRGFALEQLANVHLSKETAAGGRDALPLLRRAGELYDNTYSRLKAKSSLGRALNLTGNHTEAIRVLEAAIAENAATENDEDLLTVLLGNLGIAHRRAGNYALAERQYRRALAIDLRLCDGSKPDDYVANDYNNLSSLFLYAGKPDSARHYAQLAVDWVESEGLEMQTYLLDLGRAYVKLEDFAAALDAFRRADAVTDRLRLNQLLEETRTYWRSDARTLYTEALSAAYAAGDTESVFYFMEKARTRLLLDELTANRAYADLPEAVRSRLTSSIQRSRRSENAPREVQRFRALRDSVFAEFPAFRTAQVGPDPPETAELNDEVIVEYFLSDALCLGLVVDPGGNSRTVELAPLANWEKDLAAYLKQVADPRVKPDPRLGFHLYEILIAPLSVERLDRLTIVPDGDLYLLPFGTLLTEPAATGALKDWPWWAKSTSVHYAFSVQLLAEGRRQRGRGNGKMLALAPVARLNTGSPIRRELELPATLKTLRHLDGIFLLDTLVGPAANRENFAQLADDYSFIHLGTHAYLSTKERKNSFLLYGEDFAYYDANDLASHNFSAELVVVAGCETGLGRELPGEGVASLGRAFARRGAANLMMSLWSIDDAATANLLNLAYTEMGSGNPPGHSLNVAQRNYLSEVTNPKFAHPYYWGGLVYFGAEIELSTGGETHRNWLVIGAIALFAIGAVYLYRRSGTAEAAV